MRNEEPETYILDGKNWNDFAGFIAEFNTVVLKSLNATWGGDLNAFNDYLSWPEFPWVLVWKNSDCSRKTLGFNLMVEMWEKALKNCYADQKADLTNKLEAARNAQGPTMFDLIVEIIQDNSEFVTLRLE